MLKPFEAKIKTITLKNRMILLAFSLIFFPFKDLLIFLPSIIIKLVIALIKVSIVLNVKANANTNIEIIIKKFSLDNIR